MKKYNTSQRLHQIMEERKLKQVDILRQAEPFCKKYGIKLNRNDLSQYVSGKVEPGQEKLSILGLTLNVNEAWLMGYDDVPQKRNASLPETPSSASDDELKFALFDGSEDVTDEMFEEVKQFAAMVKMRENAKKEKK